MLFVLARRRLAVLLDVGRASMPSARAASGRASLGVKRKMYLRKKVQGENAMSEKQQQGINTVVVLGNVVSEPRRAGDALAVVLNCVERVKTDDGWGDRAVQVPILIHGKRGESLAPILKPGDRILVQGSFDARGEKRWVRAGNVVLCGGKKPGGGAASSGPSDDEIPF